MPVRRLRRVVVAIGHVTYESFEASDGYRFRIKGLNHEIVFQPAECCLTDTEAKNACVAIQRDAPTAEYLIAQAA